MNEERYHRLWMLHELWKLSKEMISFLIFFLFAKDSDFWLLHYGKFVFLLYFVCRLILIPVQWYTRTYQVKDGSIHLQRRGISRHKQMVPFSKVQYVRRTQNLFHKWTGTTSMKLEIASDHEEAIEFNVLTLQDADWIEGLVADATTQPVTEPREVEEVEDEPLEEVASEGIGESRHLHFEPTRKHIQKATFSSFSFIAVLPIFVSLVSKFEQLTGKEILITDLLENYGDTWWKLTFFGLVAVLLSLIGGYIWTYIRYSRYEISTDSEKIYIKKGFFEESTFSISKKRVQAIEFNQTFIKRLLSLTEVKLISAGSDEEKEINKLYPFLSVQDAEKLVRELLPEYEMTGHMHRLPRRALLLRLMTPSWLWLVATPLLYFFTPFGLSEYWWGLSGVLLLLVVTSRVLNVYQSGYAINHSFYQVKTGGFQTKCILFKRNKIEEVERSVNFIQRWAGLASLSTTIRANPVQVVKMDDLPAPWTRHFQDWYLQRTEEVKHLSADNT